MSVELATAADDNKPHISAPLFIAFSDNTRAPSNEISRFNPCARSTGLLYMAPKYEDIPHLLHDYALTSFDCCCFWLVVCLCAFVCGFSTFFSPPFGLFFFRPFALLLAAVVFTLYTRLDPGPVQSMMSPSYFVIFDADVQICSAHNVRNAQCSRSNILFIVRECVFH